MSLYFRIDIDSLYDEINRFQDALDVEMDVAAFRGGEIAAQYAQQNHPYQNRTGDLEASTRALDATGQFSRGDLLGGVIADTDYAQYVDGRPEFQFLEPAVNRTHAYIEHEFEEAFERAARRAGWQST